MPKTVAELRFTPLLFTREDIVYMSLLTERQLAAQHRESIDRVTELTELIRKWEASYSLSGLHSYLKSSLKKATSGNS